MILAYNTNGFAHHRLDDAVAILAELGYRGISLTPDVNHLDQKTTGFDSACDHLASQLREFNLKCVVETGARFVLDPRQKHQPTLISPDRIGRLERLDFLGHSLGIAARLGGDCLSFWSGTSTDDAPHAVLMTRLVEGCQRLVEFAAKSNLRLAFEPEPGMFIDTMDKFEELHAKVNHQNFGLTLDLGHLVCNGELPIRKHILKWKDWLWNVHIEDMKRGVHDHLMFGEGELDFADAFAGLRAINYAGMVSVELSRHSYDAVNAARKSMAFLKPFAG